MNSIDTVEAVMVFEEVFAVEVPVHEAKSLNGPTELIDWLELRLSNERPNRQATLLLRNLAVAHNNPDLAEGLGGTWRREQIEAIIREIFRD
jgi:hypothetical protein